MILLDTHALLWWALDPDQLSEVARNRLAQMEVHGGYASAISIWEIAVKLKRGKLEMPITAEEFSRRIESSGVVELLAVDAATWLRSVALPWDHRDPADRVIVATAQARGLPLLSKDARLQAYLGAGCVW
jgi:PIN domain nuclease of toxin-antitoxin system